MWWVNKFGSISGPYSDDQIRKGIRQNLFTKLHRISPDKQEWCRLDQTKFWNPVSNVPERLEIPVKFTGGKIGSVVHVEKDVPSIQQPGPVEKPVSPPESPKPGRGHMMNRNVGTVVAGTMCVACIVAAAYVTLWFGKKGKPISVVEIPSSETKSIEIEPPLSVVEVPSSEPEPTKVEPPREKEISANDFESIKGRIVLVHTKEGGNGTAFLVKMGGKKYVLTNDHVIRSKSTPEMVLIDGTRIKLGALSIAKDRDLARFEVDYEGDYFELSDRLPNNNDEIWVYGNSLGEGVITSLRGFVTGVGDRVVSVNAEIVGGNSGSPILGMDGKVVAVAAYLLNRGNGKDWTTRDTAFDRVRRFGIRVSNVDWVDVDRREYERECEKMELMKVYWDYLVPYLICQDVSEEKRGTLRLEHKDVDKRNLGPDGTDFHEMLMALSRSYAGQGSSWRKWKNVLRERGTFVERLNEAMAAGDITDDEGEKGLVEFDNGRKVDAIWENVKERHRDFNSKCKEALMKAKVFLTIIDWQNPLIRHGYSGDDTRYSVDWYLEGIQYFLDQNTQKLKDLNKTLEKLEKGGDDDD